MLWLCNKTCVNETYTVSSLPTHMHAPKHKQAHWHTQYNYWYTRFQPVFYNALCPVMMCKALPKALIIFQGAQRQTAITNTTFQLMNEGTNDSDANLSKMD